MATVTYQLPIGPLPMSAVIGDTAISYSAADFRYVIGAMYARTGRVGPNDALWLYTRAAGADWSVDVNFGQIVLGGNSYYFPERYLATLATRVNIPLTGFNTAPVATRTHGVWLGVDDKNTSGALYGARIHITEDVGAGAPLPSATTYLQLGTLTIAPAQSNIGAANIVNNLRRASNGTAPALLSYYSGFTTSSTATAYWSISDNTVRLQGAINKTTGTWAAGTVYTPVNLPSGARPAEPRAFLCTSLTGPQAARVVIAVAGDITVTPLGSNTADITGGVSLDGCCFEVN